MTLKQAQIYTKYGYRTQCWINIVTGDPDVPDSPYKQMGHFLSLEFLSLSQVAEIPFYMNRDAPPTSLTNKMTELG